MAAGIDTAFLRSSDLFESKEGITPQTHTGANFGNLRCLLVDICCHAKPETGGGYCHAPNAAANDYNMFLQLRVGFLADLRALPTIHG